MNGKLAVGSFGGGQLSAEDVVKAIDEFRAIQVPYPNLNAVGLG
jgi:hypothetical protein